MTSKAYWKVVLTTRKKSGNKKFSVLGWERMNLGQSICVVSDMRERLSEFTKGDCYK